MKIIVFVSFLLAVILFSCQPTKKSAMSTTAKTGAYLEITLNITAENRANAGGVYAKYKKPFLDQIAGAQSKELLLRKDDVQVLHGFATEADATAYLSTDLFQKDVVSELKPYLLANPEVRIYSVFGN